MPSPSASRLASGRTRTIGVVTPYIRRWFFAHLIDGIQEPLREAGYDVLLYTIGERGEDRGHAFDPDTLRKRAEGVIVLTVPVTDAEIATLDAMHIPTALAGFTTAGFPSVRIDDVEAATVATRHLIALGHTRIAHIGAKDEIGLRFPVPQARRHGYVTALSEAASTRTRSCSGSATSRSTAAQRRWPSCFAGRARRPQCSPARTRWLSVPSTRPVGPVWTSRTTCRSSASTTTSSPPCST